MAIGTRLTDSDNFWIFWAALLSQSCDDDDDDNNNHDDGDINGKKKLSNHVQVIKAPVLKFLTEVLCTINLFVIFLWCLKRRNVNLDTDSGSQMKFVGAIQTENCVEIPRRPSSDPFKIIIIIVRIVRIVRIAAPVKEVFSSL